MLQVFKKEQFFKEEKVISYIGNYIRYGSFNVDNRLNIFLVFLKYVAHYTTEHFGKIFILLLSLLSIIK